MSHLSFSSNPGENRGISESDMSNLLRDAAMKHRLSSLSFEGNTISPSALRLLERFIMHHPHLQSINLAMCGLGDEGSLSIVRACCSQRCRPMTMVFINLSLNNVTDRGCHSIGRFLKFACPPSARVALRSIALSMNPITGNGALAIIRGAVLRALELRYCRFLFPRDTPLLAQAIREDRALRTLNIEGNHCTKQEATVILHALQCNSRTQLPESSLLWGPAAGEMCALEALLRRQHGGAMSCTPRFDISREVYQEYVTVQGESLVVRGKLRDVGTSSRSGSTPLSARVVFAEVDRSPYDRVKAFAKHHNTMTCTQETASRSARADRVPSCTPAPGIGRVEARLQSESMERDSTVMLMPSTLSPYQPPLAEHEVTLRRCLSPRSSSCSRQSTSVMAAQGPMSSPSIKFQLSKGKAAQLLLDRCVVDNDQCALVFGSRRCLDALASAPEGIPLILRDIDGTPGHLNTLVMMSQARVLGIAKVLWLLLHGLGDRMALDLVAKLGDIPTFVDASPENIAQYRSKRAVENNAARRILASQQPIVSPCRSLSNIRKCSSARVDSGLRSRSTEPAHGGSCA